VVYSALGMEKPEPMPKVCYAQMSKQFLRRDPFECELCGGQMVYRRAVAGLNVQGQGLKIHALKIRLEHSGSLKNDQKERKSSPTSRSPTSSRTHKSKKRLKFNQFIPSLKCFQFTIRELVTKGHLRP